MLHLAEFGGEGVEGEASWRVAFPLGCSPQLSTTRQVINRESHLSFLGGEGVGLQSKEDQTVCDEWIATFRVFGVAFLGLPLEPQGWDQDVPELVEEDDSKDPAERWTRRGSR